MKRKRLASLLVCVMLFSLLPANALAEGEAAAARIGESEYETLDEAVTAAEDGDTIELLRDAETEAGFGIKGKTLTIYGNGHKLTFTGKAICLAKGADAPAVLNFEDCVLDMTQTVGTPAVDGESYPWGAIILNWDCRLNLKSTELKMDGSSVNGSTACYMHAGAGITLTDSTMIAEGYAGNGFSTDDGNYDVSVTLDHSSMTLNRNRTGFNSNYVVTAKNKSCLTVTNSRGHGSNGADYFIDDSTVLYDGNGSHGMSSRHVILTNGAEVTSSNNRYYGVYVNVSGDFKVDSTSSLTANYNGYAGLRLLESATKTGVVESGAKVVINGNASDGFWNQRKAVFAEGSYLEIMKNHDSGKGGGIYNTGDLTLPSGALVFNNHADKAGDDIYNLGTIAFGPVGSGWALDGVCEQSGEHHCADLIDGWYDDSEEDGRWEAHDKETLHVWEFTQFGTQPKALKAAHGVLPDPEPEPIVPAWETAKSKTATNLEKDAAGDYTSRVTLSLPSAEERLVSDVVLVLDKSSSADVEDQALAMLESLKNRLDETQAKIRVGVVSFNTRASIANGGEFFDLSTEHDAIAAALAKGPDIRGTNAHAGLLAGKAMLDGDTQVDAGRKYLIFVSDAITYMYGAEPTATAWAYPEGGTWQTTATPKNWEKKYGTDAAPADWDVWMDVIGERVGSQGMAYDYPYEGTVVEFTPQEDWDTAYANSVDKALYLTAQVYQEAKDNGYHCYAVKAVSEKSYAWSDSFMDYLADGEEVSFDGIQKDIYDLLGAGSRVVDVIGKGTYGTADRFAYDFDFVNDMDCLTLTRGEDENHQPVELPKVQIDGTTYGFGERLDEDKYEFVLHYYAEGQDGRSDECFVWDIHVPVNNFEKVHLTYTVKLTNPQLEVGKYGIYDPDGLDDETGEQLAGREYLFTNKSATLYPVDSDGNAVQPEDFSRPAVSYEVTTEPTGTLYVTKYVLDGNADPEQTFPIQVTVGGAEQSFALHPGETKALSGLTVGAAYTVLETDSRGYAANYFRETGTITGTGNGDTAVVVNVPEDECALFISKTVRNSSTNARFRFTVELTAENGAVGGTLLYTDSDAAPSEFASGGTVELANGHSAVIYGLPAGTAYKVAEAATSNYTASSVTTGVEGTDNDAVAEGTITGGTVRGVHYTNTYTAPYTPGGGGGSGGGSGGNSGGGTNLNTDDHYSYIIGYKDGTLQPYGSITRGEVATIFFRMLTDETREKYWSQTSGYSDCGPDLWCNNAISTLTNMGIIDGYQDGTFRPYGKITRAQFAKIAVGFFETTREAYRGYFTDVPEEAWYTGYVEAAARVGLVQGFDNGTFQPDTNITRAQACVIVNRALDRKPQKDHLLPESQMVTWPDCKPGDWYYADMQEATNSHDYKWLTSGSDKKYLEEWTKKLPQRDWAAFEHAWATAHSAPGGEVVK